MCAPSARPGNTRQLWERAAAASPAKRESIPWPGRPRALIASGAHMRNMCMSGPQHAQRAQQTPLLCRPGVQLRHNVFVRQVTRAVHAEHVLLGHTSRRRGALPALLAERGTIQTHLLQRRAIDAHLPLPIPLRAAHPIRHVTFARPGNTRLLWERRATFALIARPGSTRPVLRSAPTALPASTRARKHRRVPLIAATAWPGSTRRLVLRSALIASSAHIRRLAGPQHAQRAQQTPLLCRPGVQLRHNVFVRQVTRAVHAEHVLLGHTSRRRGA